MGVDNEADELLLGQRYHQDNIKSFGVEVLPDIPVSLVKQEYRIHHIWHAPRVDMPKRQGVLVRARKWSYVNLLHSIDESPTLSEIYLGYKPLGRQSEHSLSALYGGDNQEDCSVISSYLASSSHHPIEKLDVNPEHEAKKRGPVDERPLPKRHCMTAQEGEDKLWLPSDSDEEEQHLTPTEKEKPCPPSDRAEYEPHLGPSTDKDEPWLPSDGAEEDRTETGGFQPLDLPSTSDYHM